MSEENPGFVDALVDALRAHMAFADLRVGGDAAGRRATARLRRR